MSIEYFANQFIMIGCYLESEMLLDFVFMPWEFRQMFIIQDYDVSASDVQ